MPLIANRKDAIVGLLAVVTIVAAVTAIVVEFQRIERREQLVTEINSAGGVIAFTVPYDADPDNRDRSQPTTYTSLDFYKATIDDQWLSDRSTLQECPLDQLFLNGERLSDESVTSVLQLHPLEFFQGINVRISDDAAASLSSNTRFRELLLEKSHLSDSAFQRLPLERIEQLGIAGTEVTPAGLAELRRCQRLRLLILDGAQFNHEVAQVLQSNGRPLSLLLKGPTVTDEYLGWLKPVMNVSLALNRTSVTPEGIADYRVGLPDRTVFVDGKRHGGRTNAGSGAD
ncbi:MAG: hypothetical protein JNG89_13070 [Planctomycetaceae bacterium]|nr:hypothetical protein [Planctomycetaceae bacterium]